MRTRYTKAQSILPTFDISVHDGCTHYAFVWRNRTDQFSNILTATVSFRLVVTYSFHLRSAFQPRSPIPGITELLFSSATLNVGM